VAHAATVLGRVKWCMSDRNGGHSGLLKYDAVNYFSLFTMFRRSLLTHTQ